MKFQTYLKTKAIIYISFLKNTYGLAHDMTALAKRLHFILSHFQNKAKLGMQVSQERYFKSEKVVFKNNV